MPHTETSTRDDVTTPTTVDPRPLPAFRSDHVALRVSDLEATVAWYTERLDFTVTRRWPSGDLQLAYLERGDVKLELLAGAEPTRAALATDLAATFGAEGIHHLCLAVDEITATVDVLRVRGVPTLGAPFTVAEIGRDLAFIQDPAGNLIELSAPSRVD